MAQQRIDFQPIQFEPLKQEIRFEPINFEPIQIQPPPTFGSRLYEFGSGLLDFGGNILRGAVNPGSLGSISAIQNVGQGVLAPVKELGNTEYSLPARGIRAGAMLAGMNPDVISEDWQAGNYGALAGDIVPAVGIAALMRGVGRIGRIPTKTSTVSGTFRGRMNEIPVPESPLGPTGLRQLPPNPMLETISPLTGKAVPAKPVDFEMIRGEGGKWTRRAPTILPEEVPSLGIQTFDKPPLSAELPLGGTMPATAGLRNKSLIEIQKKIDSQGGRVTPNEMRRVANELPKVDRASSTFNELWNYGRSLMSSYDTSAPLRQGLGLAHRAEFRNSFVDMFKALGDENAFRAIQDGIAQSKYYGLMKEVKLGLTDLLTNREEAFLSSWAERTPVIGGGVRASNRAYVGFLNKLRADTFSNLVDSAKNIGVDATTNIPFARALGEYINNATGRGSLGKLERNVGMLNNLVFSPRLIASRLKMLNPNNYLQIGKEWGPMSPEASFLRKQYLKSLFSITGFGTALVELGRLAGGEVENDPRSSDFRKLKIGNTRLDPYGGFQQYITLASRLVSGESKSSVTGNLSTLGEHFGSPTRLDVLGRFAESKTHPIISFATGMLRGKDFTGQPFHVPTEIANRYVPMLIQDVIELAQDDPTLLPLAGLGAFGVGMQTYQPRMGGNIRFIKP